MMHSNIRLEIEADYEAMSQKAAALFSRALRKKPQGVFGFATGSTPIGMYKELIRLHEEEGLDFSGITTFNLDEYHPISRESDKSYYYFMMASLFDYVNIDPDRVYVPDGMAEDVERECLLYEAKMEAAGGIDAQILGIGHNGHIGFNEPSQRFSTNTKHVALKEMTITNNARFFENADEVPRHAITMGIRSIMMARHILLLANGAAKAEILRDALTGPITPLVPASVLQLHPSVTLVADEAAAKLL
jgi:glucosamine-6-phosphate deaminase